jgi:hypothetical protein
MERHYHRQMNTLRLVNVRAHDTRQPREYCIFVTRRCCVTNVTMFCWMSVRTLRFKWLIREPPPV